MTEKSAPFFVLADTSNYLAVDKAPGVPFHQENGQSGLLNMLRKQGNQKEEERKERLYPVHRLDTVTSGIILFARGRKNANTIANLFRRRKVEKIYLALSDRKPKKKRGLIEGGMERSRRGTWKLTRKKENLAKTLFFSVPLPRCRPGLQLYVLMPLTGRTHQLRTAMKSLGAPILGDSLYGRFDLAREEDRTYLHAYALRFFLEGEEVRFICPPRFGKEFLTEPFRKAVKATPMPFS